MGFKIRRGIGSMANLGCLIALASWANSTLVSIRKKKKRILPLDTIEWSTSGRKLERCQAPWVSRVVVACASG